MLQEGNILAAITQKNESALSFFYVISTYMDEIILLGGNKEWKKH